MSAARRNILRPPRSNGVDEADRSRRRQRLQASIERTTNALTRWQSKLRRAFNLVEKLQKKLTRLNRTFHHTDA